MQADCRRRAWAVIAALIVVTASVRSEPGQRLENSPSSGRCSTPRFRQFDFWVGDWSVSDAKPPDVVVAHARVESILNGCVLHEIYRGVDGHTGESFSIYDATRDRWHQTWVNDSGYLLTIEGSMQGGAMVLEGADTLPDGKLRQVRGVWREEPTGLREVATRSTDGGKTWAIWFDLLFRPSRR